MIKHIIALSRDAGMAIMKFYNSYEPIKVNQKNDDSLVTIADLVAHRIIATRLQAIAPDIPLLSEEDPPNWSIRQHWYCFWLVDPLDGTKEFLHRNGEFTVNIALIEDSKPVMAVVYAPFTNQIYAAEDGKAWRINKYGEQQIIKVKEAYPPLIVVSRSHSNNTELQNYLITLGKHQKIAVGSSLKFCLVAEGTAQLYPNFGLTSIWDTAAGHAVAIAAGAKVNDWHGRALDYAPRESLLNPSFLVSLF